ncbi:TPA: DUF551 domain-containing protein [Klebsiella quasipneumoniae subsp. similipneumoniae]
MESEPVAWREPFTGRCVSSIFYQDGSSPLDHGYEPLYSAPPEPVAVTDDELNAALQLHRLKVDGHSQLSDSFRAGFRYARRTTPQPAPVVPEALEHLRSIVADPRLLPRRKEWISGQQYSYVLLEEVEAIVDDACRAAILPATPVCTCPSGDGSLHWPCPVHPGNSPAIPDGYVMVPKEPTEEMLQASYREAAVYSPTAYRAMIAAAPQSPGSEPATVPGKWIPVSERMPEDRISVILWDAEIGEVTSGHYSHKTQTFYHCGDAIENEITHWMPPPCAPQEVK